MTHKALKIVLILIQQLDKNLNWKWNQLSEGTDMDVSFASDENTVSKVEYESDYIPR